MNGEMRLFYPSICYFTHYSQGEYKRKIRIQDPTNINTHVLFSESDTKGNH